MHRDGGGGVFFFSSIARISGECSIIHSPIELFLFFFFFPQWRLARAH